MSESLPIPVSPRRTAKQRRREHAVIWDAITLLPNPLPEVGFDEIDTAIRFLGRDCALPIVMNLHGQPGSPDWSTLQPLVALAQREQVPLILGAIPTDPGEPVPLDSFRAARDMAPTASLLAEIPAHALLPQNDREGIDVETLRTVMTETGLDALIIRLDFTDALFEGQERVNTTGATEAITTIVRRLRMPVLVRSDTGISRALGRGLAERGVAGLIVAGSEVFAERHDAGRGGARRGDVLRDLGPAFAGWGVPTLAAVRMLRSVSAPVVSDGRIETGLDIARAIALGADLVVLDMPVANDAEPSGAEQRLATLRDQLRAAMFLTGAAGLANLKQVPFVATGETREWLEAAEALWRADSFHG